MGKRRVKTLEQLKSICEEDKDSDLRYPDRHGVFFAVAMRKYCGTMVDEDEISEWSWRDWMFETEAEEVERLLKEYHDNEAL
jgi:hypothetical protein